MTEFSSYREARPFVADLDGGDSTDSDNSEDMETSMNSNDSNSSDTSLISGADLGEVL